MAYSNLVFSERIVRIHDLDLSIACVFVIEHGKDSDSDFLNDMFESWVDSISYGGPGCIDLRLDNYLDGQGRVGVVEGLIGDAIRDLDVMSGLYPKDRLNSMLVKVEIKLDSDYRIDLIRQALIELRRVIVGEGGELCRVRSR